MIKKVILVSILTAVLITAGTAAAYLTAESTVFINDFTSGSLSVEITESLFDGLESDDKVLYYGCDIPKNPCVRNTGNVSVYAYIELSDDSASLLYEISEGWEKIPGTDVYAYTVSPIGPGESTGPLFTSVTWPDIQEGTFIMGAQINLDVRAVGIQYDNILVSGESFGDRAKAVFLTYGETVK